MAWAMEFTLFSPKPTGLSPLTELRCLIIFMGSPPSSKYLDISIPIKAVRPLISVPRGGIFVKI